MFNMGVGEIAVILIAALILLGPQKLPELARGLGKFMREFRRQTDDVRTMVEREFYAMDQEFQKPETPSKAIPASAQNSPGAGSAAAGATAASVGLESSSLGIAEGGPASLASNEPEKSIGSSLPDPGHDLYDAQYHAMEANGTLPAQAPASQLSPQPSAGYVNGPAAPAPEPKKNEPQPEVPTPRGK